MGMIGRSTDGPAQAATWRAYVPAALTTWSQTYDPASVSTLHRPSGKGAVPVTLVLRLMAAPLCRAPSAKANTAPAGST